MRYTYVICFVSKASAGPQFLMNNLSEKVSGDPCVDVANDVSNGSLSFHHVFVDADSVDQAYSFGQKKFDYLLSDEKGEDSFITWNDYVVESGYEEEN